MADVPAQMNLFPEGAPPLEPRPAPPLPEAEAAAGAVRLTVTLDAGGRWMRLDSDSAAGDATGVALRISHESNALRAYPGQWRRRVGEDEILSKSTADPASVRAQLNRLKREFGGRAVEFAAYRAAAGGRGDSSPAVRGEPVALPPGVSPWLWLEREIVAMLRAEERRFEEKVWTAQGDDVTEAIQAARRMDELRARAQAATAPKRNLVTLHILLDYAEECVRLQWENASSGSLSMEVCVRRLAPGRLEWRVHRAGRQFSLGSRASPSAIEARLHELAARHPATHWSARERRAPRSQGAPVPLPTALTLPADAMSWAWVRDQIHIMAKAAEGSPATDVSGSSDPALEAYRRHEQRQRERAERERLERAATLVRLREKRRQKQALEQARAATRKLASAPPAPVRPPLPEVPIRLTPPPVGFQATLPLPTGLRAYFLRERAAVWWVSNQSDDLLALPHCRIQRLEYQLRTALRVVGPLRGRALLSDEVGLGKTIEAGLVLKEYLTRGMVRRFLVLTVPSLVDQWAEELAEKFNLTVATTNQEAYRADPAAFWRGQTGIVASLHTLKLPAHLAVAREVTWDLLIVDEAHYLRNRTSLAWEAVNALPRQFLLLLTATPVQNSLEELYNLVTLLQPGQLPSPKEFRARYVDPKHPQRPRAPEELRRLLGQVMIRNTRANAGLQLPPRRAETVLFDAAPEERAFWQQWETEFRAQLARLNSSQAGLWGRLLLQAAGSSPAAWLEALTSFPDRTVAEAWRARAPLEASWTRKCELLVPLTRGEGGVVVFTQFLQTQAALALALQAASVPVWVIHGQTPPADRQPITEQFRQRGGALLLTHSGTEGRNLQFSHRLVNFDLPWNPMEIEQRIGRLHRLGQQHPVRIYNFVQAGTLQQHLLEVLQEKLNLFELVIGETGLILGDRFGSDEFAEEVLRRWRDAEGAVGPAFAQLGAELASARADYQQVKQLDETLFAKDYESL